MKAQLMTLIIVMGVILNLYNMGRFIQSELWAMACLSLIGALASSYSGGRLIKSVTS